MATALPTACISYIERKASAEMATIFVFLLSLGAWWGFFKFLAPRWEWSRKGYAQATTMHKWVIAVGASFSVAVLQEYTTYANIKKYYPDIPLA
jgi:hypothetical protein